MVVQIVDTVVFVLIVLAVMSVLGVLIVMSVTIVRMSQVIDGRVEMFNMTIIAIILQLCKKLMAKSTVIQKVSDIKNNIYFFVILIHKF